MHGREERDRRWKAAGADRGPTTGREHTTVPGVQAAPTPGRNSAKRNVTTPMGSGRHCPPVGRTRERLNFPSGRRMTREANAGGRKAPGNREPDAGPSASGSRITGRIGALPRPERALTRVWWACGGKQAATPEPKGKLDTVNGTADSLASAPVLVNGPEDGLPEWDQVNWGQAGENVRRLRQRIFAASRAGDLKKVRGLQKLMLRSRSNALVSVRRVTEVNAGRKTAGVDGRIVLGSWGRLAWPPGSSTGRPRGGRGRSSGCMCLRATAAVAASGYR